VHANWRSLEKDGSVRVKIVVDNQEGYVKFKKVRIASNNIRKNIQGIKKVINLIGKYKESVLQF
jgi:hypothetical protein